MADKKEVISIQQFKRKGTWNIGLILFGVIFIYLVITILTYVTKDRVAAYEVREGSILKDTAFTGMALREEKVVTAEESGYVNYFTEADQKMAAGARAYVVSPNRLEATADKEKNDEVKMSAEDWNGLMLKAQNFNDSFCPQDFKTARTLKEETTALIESNTNQNRVTQLNSLIKDSSGGLKVYKSADDGIIEYTMDGYEDMTAEGVGDSQLARQDYSQTELMNNTEVKAGEPVYRLITDENWTLVIKLPEEMEKQFRKRMGDRKSLAVKVKFKDDGETMWGTMKIKRRGRKEVYGHISFSSGMVRYAKKRFLDVELILDDQDGLKIPKSSVTTKEFYVVPEDYLTTGGASKSAGVLRQTRDKKGNSVTEFCQTTVYYRDTETGMIYLSKDVFRDGDLLVKPESAETLALGKTDSLQGVFNINKGYAVFKQVNILCESEEYYIVEEGNRYGLSNYDHIALDGTGVRENDVISQ